MPFKSFIRRNSAPLAAVVVITGLAGVGKTVLALAWAHMLRPDFPGGQVYADLRGDTAAGIQPETVLGDFLYALGIPTESIPGGLARRVGLYRTLTQGRALLVVLDNARSAAQVDLLLRVDPAQRPRLKDIRENLTARIAEAEQQGWLGEAEGLRVSLSAAEGKLTQLDERARRATTINLGIPTFHEIAGRTATLPTRTP